MPSFAIHLAIAYEMIRKKNNDILDEEEFILGNIAPDMTNDKEKSHNHMDREIYEGRDKIRL